MSKKKEDNDKTCVDCNDYNRPAEKCENEDSCHFGHKLAANHPACSDSNIE